MTRRCSRTIRALAMVAITCLPASQAVANDCAAAFNRITAAFITESKIHRKCSDAEAAAVYPGAGRTAAEVTDDLFNLYGLPWVAALRDMSAPHGPGCARATLTQSGYAARDELRTGRDNWPLYGRLAARYCPTAIVDELDDMSAAFLLPDLGGGPRSP